MHRLAFSIDHQGCWAIELTRKFPGTTCVLRSSLPMGGKARYILSARPLERPQVEAAVKFLNEHPSVGSCRLLEVRGDTAIFLLDGDWERSISGVVMEHGGFLFAPAIIEGGREYWQVGIAEPGDAKGIMAAVSELGDLTLEAVVRDTFSDYRLTESQKRALRAAVDRGYYEFPRQTSPTKLADELGVAKATLIEHLQKAEAKVILAQTGAY